MQKAINADLVISDPAHHFAELREVRALGFWVFLMSDAVIFALLFATYVSMSGNHAGGPTGKALFDLTVCLGETALLLASSLTCGLAALAAIQASSAVAIGFLVITFLLGCGFVGMEAVEFARMIGDGAGPDRSGFLSAFFTLVGTHGLHVSVGLVWLVVMIAQLVVKGPSQWVLSRLERWSTFWHFLDVIWIGIFSVVYLPGIL